MLNFKLLTSPPSNTTCLGKEDVGRWSGVVFAGQGRGTAYRSSALLPKPRRGEKCLLVGFHACQKHLLWSFIKLFSNMHRRFMIANGILFPCHATWGGGISTGLLHSFAKITICQVNGPQPLLHTMSSFMVQLQRREYQASVPFLVHS
ncbi:hypothetical protein SUGI_1097790 [Cryptomeria japonica]|nr:hypothetical protein SUGI_1097790 [Cryptomeria japonica]